MSQIDVLIIGAGPTGLMIASEMTRYGLSCRIIERNKHRSDKSKALAIQSRTLEILAVLGIIDPFLERGQKLKAGNLISQNRKVARFELSLLDSTFPFILSLPQSATEEILENHLNSLGMQVEREVELINLIETDKIVKSTILNHKTNQKEEIESSYVVGCDGAHSFVRKYLNFPFEGKSFSDVFSLADVKMKWKHPHNELYAFPNSQGTIAAIPLPNKDHYRLIFQLERCRNALKENTSPLDHVLNEQQIPEPTIEEAQNLIRRFADPKAVMSNPEWLANFHVNSRLVNHYQKGRFFLAGDAAHIHSPVGGQGMNTGLQDAFNLGWKLAFTFKKQANQKVLNSYDKERHDVAKQLLKGTEFATYAATLHNPVTVFFRNLLMSYATKFKFVQKKIVQNISQIAVHYGCNLLTKENGIFKSGPKAGYRAPNAPLLLNGKETDLFTLLKNPTSFFLLIFSGSKHKNLSELSLPKSNIPMTPIIILNSKSDTRLPFQFALDQNGQAHAIYGAQEGAVYIIRPDCYIGFRDSDINMKNIEEYFNALSESSIEIQQPLVRH